MNIDSAAIPLGKKSKYISVYTPELLYPIPRQINRDAIQIPHPLPFKGIDIWNAYEISWLDEKGKPQIAIGRFEFPCESPCIVESKSFKLYLNSFNDTRIKNLIELESILTKDLSNAVQLPVSVKLTPAREFKNLKLHDFQAECIDDLDIEIDTYHLSPTFLNVGNEIVEETLVSHLLKANCLVTNQPDWGSVLVHYAGPKIDREGLLKYFISFRHEQEFSEQFIERIYIDLCNYCKPTKLTVQGLFTRRGGLDINPFRTNEQVIPQIYRNPRQ